MIQDVSYFMPGGKAGIVLIHGLTGTPSEMHILAKGLNRAGFSVYGMQLAGHCGNEADLNKTGWKDWYKSVIDAADFMLKKVDMLFVGGLSMGAVLSLKLAADYPEKVSGVGVYGATFHYDGWSIPFYARNFAFLSRFFKKLGIFQNKVFMERSPYGVKDERIRKSVEESMKSGDSTKAGLVGNPFPAVAEMLTLNKKVIPLLPKVTAPCLIMHSANDDIANITSNGGLVAREVKGLVEFVPLDNSYHLITIDRDRRLVIEKSAEFFTKLCPPAIRASLKPGAGSREILSPEHNPHEAPLRGSDSAQQKAEQAEADRYEADRRQAASRARNRAETAKRGKAERK